MGMGFAGEPTGPTAGEFHRSGLQHWIGKQPYEPTKKEIGKQAGVLKKLISDHGGQSVLLAIMGVAFTFPHTKGEPWDFVTVRRRFSEFKANAAKFEEAMGVGDALEQFDSDWDSAREGLVL